MKKLELGNSGYHSSSSACSHSQQVRYQLCVTTCFVSSRRSRNTLYRQAQTHEGLVTWYSKPSASASDIMNRSLRAMYCSKQESAKTGGGLGWVEGLEFASCFETKHPHSFPKSRQVFVPKLEQSNTDHFWQSKTFRTLAKGAAKG